MLFIRELKKTIMSVAYILFAAVLVIALWSQDIFDFGDSRLEEPQPGQSYGVKNVKKPELIMPEALRTLYQEYAANNYRTYPIGFYKEVKLSAEKQQQIAEILAALTGQPVEEGLSISPGGGGNTGDGATFQINGADSLIDNGGGSFTVSSAAGQEKESPERRKPELLLREDVSYEEFKQHMAKADDILGGGSQYALDALTGFGVEPVTYEEAAAQYKLAKEHDRITGGYARLFSDYAGVMACSILPVFLAVVMSMKDRSSKMAPLVHARKVSSFKLVAVRYAAVVTAVMLPVLLLAYLSNIPVWSEYGGIQLDYLAPLKYSLGWLLPTVMVVCALGMCLTELTGSPIAVAVQGFWWFIDVNAGYKSAENAYSLFRLAPRHNVGPLSRFRTADFIDNFDRLVANRLLFAGLAVLLVILTVFIYEAKRRGRLNGSYRLKNAVAGIQNRRGESAA